MIYCQIIADQYSTNRLRTILKTKCFEAGQLTRNFSNNRQHDAAEFIQSLLEHLWHENKNIPSLKEQLFGGLCQDVLECECRGRVESPVQNMPEIIPLQLNGQSIQSCLNSFFSPSEINWKCPNCGRGKVVKRTSIILEPFTLMLQLMRYKVDEENHTV